LVPAYRFVGPLLPAVEQWEKTLSVISEVTDEWLSVQRKWLYMEEVFLGGDLRKQLPDESSKFDDIDLEYRKVPGSPEL
jgi:dynein heavy chain